MQCFPNQSDKKLSGAFIKNWFLDATAHRLNGNLQKRGYVFLHKSQEMIPLIS